MTRTYGRIECWVCGKYHSRNGLATVNHMRKHVREGRVVEVIDGFGYYGFQAIKIVDGKTEYDYEQHAAAP